MCTFIACRNDKHEEEINNSIFEKKYGSYDADDYATSLASHNNFIYVLGSTNAQHASRYELLLMKLNDKGDSLWSKTYGGTENTTGEKLVVMSDGLLLCGPRVRDGGADKEFYIVKTDFDGVEQWSHSTGTLLDDVLLGACNANTDGCLLCGFNATTQDGLNVFLVRVNNNGDTLWTRSYGTPFYDGAADAIATPDGFIVYGFTDTASNANRNFYLLHLNEQGAILNTKIIDKAGYEEAQAIIRLANGNYLFSGHSASIDPIHNLYGEEIDAQLNTLHSFELGGAMHDGGEGVAQDESGNYVFLARSSSYGSGDEDVVLFTSDATGTLKKLQRFGDTGNQEAYQILSYDHTLILAGATAKPGGGNHDFYVIRCEE